MDAGRAREKFRRLSGGLRINQARLGVGVTENSAAIAGGGDLRPRVNHGFDGNQRTVMEEGSWTSESKTHGFSKSKISKGNHIHTRRG